MSLQTKLDNLNSQITAIDNEIASIDAETVGVTAVADYLSDRRADLVIKKNRLSSRATAIQSKIDNPITTSQQTIIDNLNTMFNNTYSNELNNLKTMPVERRTEFFDLITAATNESEFVCECIVKQFFGII